jgi:hypothetical protein
MADKPRSSGKARSRSAGAKGNSRSGGAKGSSRSGVVKSGSRSAAPKARAASGTNDKPHAATPPSSQSGAPSRSNGRGSMNAIEAVQSAREQLALLLGRPVEAVLGVERDSSNWVLRAQVLELERIPNTTDVLGEYEALIDRSGELLRYSRTRRYHRGHVDEER